VSDKANAVEHIISKKDADFVFSLRKHDWETEVKKFFAPGWTIRSFQLDTGMQVAGYDPSTGFGISIQPLYRSSSDDPPEVVIVGSYFPPGAMPPMNEQAQKGMETTAQQDLGAAYHVGLSYERKDNLDCFHLILAKSA
jgi:hypothetical protein